MCGRFIIPRVESVIDHFGIDLVEGRREPSTDVRPTQAIWMISPIIDDRRQHGAAASVSVNPAPTIEPDSAEIPAQKTAGDNHRFDLGPDPSPAQQPPHDRRRLSLARWGLVPAWSKTISSRPLINARAETVTSKPSFREAAARRRVIIPAAGYYEWALSHGHKQPYWLHADDERLLAFAGLYDWWRAPEPPSPGQGSAATPNTAVMDPLLSDQDTAAKLGHAAMGIAPAADHPRDDSGAPSGPKSSAASTDMNATAESRSTSSPGVFGHWLCSATIITRPATDALGHIHDRMPVVVPLDSVDDWLDPDLTDLTMVDALLRSLPDPTLTPTPRQPGT
ncbi:MAG: SOS response-associated peptidase family protein [Propionibacteriaceae bacterium]|jgi:putative SOS response-associated peptidase YedK|nr:SOS response-associated peptidase family protein [Propionibacteriaceae bacterium]